MFWTDWGENAKIEKAGMNGSNRTVIVSKNIYWPNGLTVDYSARKIYWTDAKLSYIARADYNGLNYQTILKDTLPHPFALSVYENVVYWTDWTLRAIYSCNKKTGQNMQVVMSDIYSPMDIHVYERDRQQERPRGMFFFRKHSPRQPLFCYRAQQSKTLLHYRNASVFELPQLHQN